MLLESCPTSSGKVSTGLWSFVTTCPEKHFEEKRFFSQKIDFFRNRLCLSENFSVIVKKLSAGLPKLLSECPLGTFSIKILFLRKNLFHLIFANRAGKFSPCVEVLYGGLSKSPSTCPMGHFEGFFFPICFLSFPIPDTDRKISCNFGKHSYGIVKTDSRCMSIGKYWRKNFYSKYCVFHPFWTMSRKFSAFWQSFQGRVLKTTF